VKNENYRYNMTSVKPFELRSILEWLRVNTNDHKYELYTPHPLDKLCFSRLRQNWRYGCGCYSERAPFVLNENTYARAIAHQLRAYQQLYAFSLPCTRGYCDDSLLKVDTLSICAGTRIHTMYTESTVGVLGQMVVTHAFANVSTSYIAVLASEIARLGYAVFVA
jgi:hypothetical protein